MSKCYNKNGECFEVTFQAWEAKKHKMRLMYFGSWRYETKWQAKWQDIAGGVGYWYWVPTQSSILFTGTTQSYYYETGWLPWKYDMKVRKIECHCECICTKDVPKPGWDDWFKPIMENGEVTDIKNIKWGSYKLISKGDEQSWLDHPYNDYDKLLHRSLLGQEDALAPDTGGDTVEFRKTPAGLGFDDEYED